MRATFIYAAGDVRVTDAPDPELLEPTDALVQVTRACVCGSDLHPYHSAPEKPGGTSIGHELIGVITDVGPEVKTLTKGDFVIAPFAISCGVCEFCRAGLQTSCVNGGFWNDADLGTAGCQAEAVRVPLADGTLVKVPGVDPATADEGLLASLLTLSDVYGTGWHAAHRAGVTSGDTVAVIGDGAVGLLAVLSARQLGAERIILMGRHQARTDLGREFGATDVVAERDQDGINTVLELTKGGAAKVLEAVGHLPAYDQAVGIVRPGGVISRVGVPQYQQWEMEGFGRDWAIPLSHGFKVGLGTVAMCALYEIVLGMDLGAVDIEARLASWPTPDQDRARVEALQPTALIRASAVRESAEKYLTPDAARERLETVRRVWPELRFRLAQQLMPAAEVEDILRRVGAVHHPSQIGVSLEQLKTKYLQAQTIRARYTVLDTLQEVGVLVDVVDRLFAPGGYWYERTPEPRWSDES